MNRSVDFTTNLGETGLRDIVCKLWDCNFQFYLIILTLIQNSQKLQFVMQDCIVIMYHWFTINEDLVTGAWYYHGDVIIKDGETLECFFSLYNSVAINSDYVMGDWIRYNLHTLPIITVFDVLSSDLYGVLVYQFFHGVWLVRGSQPFSNHGPLCPI